jgi:hypothetical protein
MHLAYETGVVTTLPAKLIITYIIYVGNWWSLKESNHPPTTPQLKATDLQSAERNRLLKLGTDGQFRNVGLSLIKRMLFL